MGWIVSPEWVSLIFIVILIVYSRESISDHSRKNIIYTFFIYYVLFQVSLSIISIISIENLDKISENLNNIIQLIFFISLPGITFIFFLYSISIVFGNRVKAQLYFLLSTPYLIYIFYVFKNLNSGYIYKTSKAIGFIPGKGFYLIYLASTLYLAMTLLLVFVWRKRLDRNTKYTLYSVPFITCGIYTIQLFIPNVVLTGTAATAGLFITYLYLQNKREYTDILVGIKNRKAFNSELEYLLRSNQKMCIILISLDDFKEINDKYGHQIGDEVLISFGNRLKKIEYHEYIYRYSGDEFALIYLSSISKNPENYILRLKELIEKKIKVSKYSISLSASISVVEVPEHADTERSIVRTLEYGIESSKKKGRGIVTYSDDDSRRIINREKNISKYIDTAISEDLFEVFFQPIYSSELCKFSCAEALLRLRNKEIGHISPAEFIPIAEKRGLMHQLNLKVISETCRFIRELQKRRCFFEFISINMSVTQLKQSTLIKDINKILKEFDVDSSKIYIEVTESIFIDDMDSIVKIMNELAQFGYRFCIDDFGTGFSNLANIVSLPIEVVKLDKSLIYKSVINEKSASLIKDICIALKNVGLNVLSEGVEEEIQLEFCKSLDSEYIQGFYYAYPMEVEEAMKYF